MAKTPEELYQEREKRVLDAIALRKPDRVPIAVLFGFFPAKYAGMTVEEAMYDPDKLFDAQTESPPRIPAGHGPSALCEPVFGSRAGGPRL